MGPDDYKLTDIDRTLDMFDFDGSGTIDINEFLEVNLVLFNKFSVEFIRTNCIACYC